MLVMITRKTLLCTFFVVKMNTQRVKKKGVSYIKILKNGTRIWSYCFECATALSRATAAEKETALGLEVGSYTNTFAPRCSLKAWVSRLGSPPLCFACRRPLGRSGILVLTCTGLSVSPRASLSSPARPPPPASCSSSFPSPGSSFHRLSLFTPLRSHCLIYLARHVSRLLPILSLDDTMQHNQ